MRRLLAILWFALAATGVHAQSIGDSKPIPDPTVQTTQQLDRAIENARALSEALRIGDNRLVDERFKSVDQQFENRDTALAAALSAAKEAVGKTEERFAIQIAALERTIAEAGKNTDGQINDINLRLSATEGQSKGSDNTWATIVAGIGILALIAGVAIAAVGLRRPTGDSRAA